MKSIVLLIDDDKDFCLALQKEAEKVRLQLTFVHDLEDGMALLEDNRRIMSVILDGHCLLESDQPEGPGVNFVYHALHLLNDLEHEQNRMIPCCVNSEKPGEFTEELKGLIPVFNKLDDPEPLFNWLKQCIKNLPEMVVKQDNPSVFDHLESVFSDKEEAELIDLLIFSDKPDVSDIPAKLAVIRRLLEKFADVVCIKLLHKEPSYYASGAGVSVKRIFDVLYSSKMIHAQIRKHVHHLYSYCSEYGNHIYRHKIPPYEPGIYAYRHYLNTFLEIVAYCQAIIHTGE